MSKESELIYIQEQLIEQISQAVGLGRVSLAYRFPDSFEEFTDEYLEEYIGKAVMITSRRLSVDIELVYVNRELVHDFTYISKSMTFNYIIDSRRK